MDEIPRNDLEIEESSMEQMYLEAITELRANDFASFGGFYYENSNARARVLGNAITVNEKYLTIPKDEIERISRHEVQHTINSFRKNELGDDEGKALFAFVLHPSFKDLHDRMQRYYTVQQKQGYPFKKIVQPIPTRYSDVGESSHNYTHPDEILALLSGYKKYLKQVEQGDAVKTAPYEFIEAFKPEDLELLDEQVRFRLATELVSRNPHILDAVEGESIVITAADLV